MTLRRATSRLTLPALAAIAATLLLTSCATAEGEGASASRQGRIARFPHNMASGDCFFQNRIDNFEVLNDSNLLVFDGRRRVYHVEISPPSMDLRHAYGIQFRSSTGRVCGNPGERLQISGGSFGSFPLSVTGVYRLDAVTQTAVRAHFGQAVAQPPLPEDEDAAAIEELVTDLEEEENPAGEEPQTSSPGEDQEN
ncbi:MAG: DUF6491 family protein [Gammaproteobacteria bacterium]|nr:DUF6491 family protein [Gammaproteobacteria bacterium]MDE0414484.1 DUF6491 family protein [Gammaproteobacteria bacterium]MDE0487882.1 DUF6491 family protein [Gammaproteobacteria bacterium]